MKLLPIEPGCKAIILPPHIQAGEEVRVIKRAPKKESEFEDGANLWEINTAISWVGAITGTERKFNLCSEENLMRIDGHEDLFKEETTGINATFYGPSITEIIKKPAKQG